MIKTCSECSVEFFTKYRTTVCSDYCRKQRKNFISSKWNKENIDKVRAMSKNTQIKRRKNGLARQYQIERRQSKAGYIDRFLERIKLNTPNSDIDRDYLEVIFPNVCEISKTPFSYTKNYEAFHNATAPSIDRINPKIGYYKGNVQIILSCINRMKNDMPNKEFLELWRYLTQK